MRRWTRPELAWKRLAAYSMPRYYLKVCVINFQPLGPGAGELKRKDYRSTLQWLHNERDGVTNHQHHDCLLNRLFRRRSKKVSKRRVTSLCEGNSPVTGEFPAQRASNAENFSIWWSSWIIVVIIRTILSILSCTISSLGDIQPW